MAVSVRMNPALERELEQAAQRAGITKSQFIIDAVERALGRKDAFSALQSAQRSFGIASGDVQARAPLAGTSAFSRPVLKGELAERHERALQDWLAYQAARREGRDWSPDDGAQGAP